VPVDRYLPDWLVPLYSGMTAEEEQCAALLACIEMIRTGTTTFCEAGSRFDVRTVAAAVHRIGMRAVLGRWTWDREGGQGRMQQSTQEALRANEAMLDALAKQQVGRAKLPIESKWPVVV
jgi:5-methylthioadenosine/S-adenosylhomocysteine deaminase